MNFIEVSSILENTSIHCGSYEKILPPENKIDKKTSFIYLDPPYIPNSDTEGFTDYSKEGFDERAHDMVANVFHQLANIVEFHEHMNLKKSLMNYLVLPFLKCLTYLEYYFHRIFEDFQMYLE